MLHFSRFQVGNLEAAAFRENISFKLLYLIHTEGFRKCRAQFVGPDVLNEIFQGTP